MLRAVHFDKSENNRFVRLALGRFSWVVFGDGPFGNGPLLPDAGGVAQFNDEESDEMQRDGNDKGPGHRIRLQGAPDIRPLHQHPSSMLHDRALSNRFGCSATALVVAQAKTCCAAGFSLHAQAKTCVTMGGLTRHAEARRWANEVVPYISFIVFGVLDIRRR